MGAGLAAGTAALRLLGGSGKQYVLTGRRTEAQGVGMLTSLNKEPRRNSASTETPAENKRNEMVCRRDAVMAHAASLSTLAAAATAQREALRLQLAQACGL